MINKLLNYVIGVLVGFCICVIVNYFYTGIPMYVYIFFSLLLTGLYVEYSENKLLLQKNKVRDEAMSLISHEMRTGLTSAHWVMQIILKKYENQYDENDKKMLQDSIDVILNTVKHSVGLLNVSMVDMNKFALSIVPMNVPEFRKKVSDIVNKYKIVCEQKKIVLNLDFDLSDDLIIEMDILRISIVIENIIDNAIEYLLLEKKEINIKIFQENRMIVCSISDTGIGIPDNAKSKIFSEFYRADNAKEQVSTGSGIGLYTSLQYIKKHKGDITFSTQENKGTTFKISIPIKQKNDAYDLLKKI